MQTFLPYPDLMKKISNKDLRQLFVFGELNSIETNRWSYYNV